VVARPQVVAREHPQRWRARPEPRAPRRRRQSVAAPSSVGASTGSTAVRSTIPRASVAASSGRSAPDSQAAALGSARIKPVRVPAAVTGVLVRFTACMHANGVLGFPGPTGAGFSLAGTHLNPASPRYRAAEARCNQILLGLDSRK
jgi:hypothetical protein